MFGSPAKIPVKWVRQAIVGIVVSSNKFNLICNLVRRSNTFLVVIRQKIAYFCLKVIFCSP